MSHDGRWVVFDVEGREGDVGIRHRNQGIWHANRDGQRWKVGTPEGNRGHHPDISADGQWIVYVTDARLSPQDNNYVEDVYVWRARDTYHNSLELISCGIRGGAGDGQVYGPARISADGRYVAWTSHATNYVDIGGDPDGPVGSIFVRDRTFGRTSRIPVTPAYEGAGTHIEKIDFQFTEEGQFQVAFETAAALVRDDTNGKKDVYVVTADPGVFTLGGNRHAFRQHSPEHAGDKALWSVELVSVGPNGALGDADSYGAHILQPSTSRAAAEFGGRPLVVFTSNARTLSTREGDLDSDVFVQAFDASWTGLGPLPPRQLTSNLSPQEKSRCTAGDAENLASGDIGIAMTCRGPLVREDVNHIADVYVQTLAGAPVLALSIIHI